MSGREVDDRAARNQSDANTARAGDEANRIAEVRATELREGSRQREKKASSASSDDGTRGHSERQSLDRSDDYSRRFGHSYRPRESSEADPRIERNKSETRNYSANEIASLRATKEEERQRLEFSRKQELHKAAHHDYLEKVVANEIERGQPSDMYVNSDDILSPNLVDEGWDEGKPDFWYHHGNTPESYNAAAERYAEIRQRLGRGETLESIKSDQNLRSAVEFWWSKEEPVKLTKYQDTYIVEAGYHRSLLAQNHCLGEIPATVTEARLKRGMSS